MDADWHLATTPLGLFSVGREPKVASRSAGQPWAEGHNPVGIETAGYFSQMVKAGKEYFFR
jgi:hypothetical protein